MLSELVTAISHGGDRGTKRDQDPLAGPTLVNRALGNRGWLVARIRHDETLAWQVVTPIDQPKIGCRRWSRLDQRPLRQYPSNFKFLLAWKKIP